MIDDPALAAEKLKQLLIDSSPLIEEYTAAVCPDCIAICCRQKHGLYRERDIFYLRGSGNPVPPRDGTRPLEGPCEAMGPTGCVQPRWMRPFKCTWYFCEPLLAALNEGPQKKARRFSAVMQEMIDLYGALPDHEARKKEGEDAWCIRIDSRDDAGAGACYFPKGQTG